MVKLPNALSDRPWAIARILPSAKAYIVARFRNRQDADDHLRVLYRFIPSAIFEIVFDPVEEEVPDKQAL
jgi:putative acetyltransferase